MAMTRAPSSGLCRPTRARSWFQDKVFDGDTPVAFKHAKGWSCDNIFLESSRFPFSRQLAEGEKWKWWKGGGLDLTSSGLSLPPRPGAGNYHTIWEVDDVHPNGYTSQ